MSRAKGKEALGMLANMVVMATLAYTVIIIVKSTPQNAGKPATK
jgi:hypothetical protein